MQPSYNLPKERSSRNIINNNWSFDNNNTVSQKKTGDLPTKLKKLSPPRSQSPKNGRATETRGATDLSRFRIVHTPDKKPLYVPPRPRQPKTNKECREALEEMYAISRSERRSIGGERTGRQIQQPSQRYASILQGTTPETIWINMRIDDLKRRVADNEYEHYSSSSSSRGQQVPPPPPLKDQKFITPRSFPGKLSIPPTPKSAGGPRPDSFTRSPTTNIPTAWRAPVPTRVPPTPTTPTTARSVDLRGHKRMASGDQPLRAPRPLSERPMISLDTSKLRGQTSQNTPSPLNTSRPPKKPTFRSISEILESKPPVDARNYEDLTTRRSQPRIPMSMVRYSMQATDRGETPSWEEGDNKTVAPARRRISKRRTDLIPIVTTENSDVQGADAESKCYMCDSPPIPGTGLCAQCHAQFEPVGEDAEYSDSEYGEDGKGRSLSVATLSNVKFPPTPISPRKSLARGGGGDGSSNIPVAGMKRMTRSTSYAKVVKDMMRWTSISSPTARHNNQDPEGHQLPTTSSLPHVAQQLKVTSPLPIPPPPPPPPENLKISVSSPSLGSNGAEEPSSAMFHLERSMKNDPRYFPLTPGASPPKGFLGHEFVRLGRVPSGGGLMVHPDQGGNNIGNNNSTSNDKSTNNSNGNINDVNNSKVGGGGGNSKRNRKRSDDDENGDSMKMLANESDESRRQSQIIEKQEEAGVDEKDWFSYYMEESKRNERYVDPPIRLLSQIIG